MNVLLFCVLGAIAGSFANVVIHRVPKGASIVKPGSSCPSCARPISPLENIPIISFLALRGRCRGCGTRIRLRYLLVEVAVAGLWGFTAQHLGFEPALPAFLVFVTTLVILSAIDLETRRLPNKIVGPGAVVAIVLLTGAAVVSRDEELIKGAALGALAYCIPMLALAVAAPGGMGMGDVKFAGYLGLHLGAIGLVHVAVGAFAAFFLGAAAGVVMMLLGKKGRKETIPFGPSLAAGAIIAFFWTEPIVEVWLG